MSRRPPSARTINKRIHRVMEDVELLCQGLESLAEQLPAPTQAELEAMTQDQQPLTLDALLLGVLSQGVFYLSEVNAVLERHTPFTPAAHRRAERSPWRSDLLGFLKVAVEVRKVRRAREEV